ncbi:hypothetical protein FACS1894113_0950 [Alphaproteobacteria bacterium]|nr:hypothetical protein FACS1894113_0950 [Alphaproteobacteria bacterium]
MKLLRNILLLTIPCLRLDIMAVSQVHAASIDEQIKTLVQNTDELKWLTEDHANWAHREIVPTLYWGKILQNQIDRGYNDFDKFGKEDTTSKGFLVSACLSGLMHCEALPCWQMRHFAYCCAELYEKLKTGNQVDLHEELSLYPAIASVLLELNQVRQPLLYNLFFKLLPRCVEREHKNIACVDASISGIFKESVSMFQQLCGEVFIIAKRDRNNLKFKLGSEDISLNIADYASFFASLKAKFDGLEALFDLLVDCNKSDCLLPKTWLEKTYPASEINAAFFADNPNMFFTYIEDFLTRSLGTLDAFKNNKNLLDCASKQLIKMDCTLLPFCLIELDKKSNTLNNRYFVLPGTLLNPFDDLYSLAGALGSNKHTDATLLWIPNVLSKPVQSSATFEINKSISDLAWLSSSHSNWQHKDIIALLYCGKCLTDKLDLYTSDFNSFCADHRDNSDLLLAKCLGELLRCDAPHCWQVRLFARLCSKLYEELKAGSQDDLREKLRLYPEIASVLLELKSARSSLLSNLLFYLLPYCVAWGNRKLMPPVIDMSTCLKKGVDDINTLCGDDFIYAKRDRNNLKFKLGSEDISLDVADCSSFFASLKAKFDGLEDLFDLLVENCNKSACLLPKTWLEKTYPASEINAAFFNNNPSVFFEYIFTLITQSQGTLDTLKNNADLHEKIVTILKLGTFSHIPFCLKELTDNKSLPDDSCFAQPATINFFHLSNLIYEMHKASQPVLSSPAPAAINPFANMPPQNPKTNPVLPSPAPAPAAINPFANMPPQNPNTNPVLPPPASAPAAINPFAQPPQNPNTNPFANMPPQNPNTNPVLPSPVNANAVAPSFSGVGLSDYRDLSWLNEKHENWRYKEIIPAIYAGKMLRDKLDGVLCGTVTNLTRCDNETLGGLLLTDNLRGWQLRKFAELCSDLYDKLKRSTAFDLTDYLSSHSIIPFCVNGLLYTEPSPFGIYWSLSKSSTPLSAVTNNQALSNADFVSRKFIDNCLTTLRKEFLSEFVLVTRLPTNTPVPWKDVVYLPRDYQIPINFVGLRERLSSMTSLFDLFVNSLKEGDYLISKEWFKKNHPDKTTDQQYIKAHPEVITEYLATQIDIDDVDINSLKTLYSASPKVTALMNQLVTKNSYMLFPFVLKELIVLSQQKPPLSIDSIFVGDCADCYSNDKNITYSKSGAFNSSSRIMTADKPDYKMVNSFPGMNTDGNQGKIQEISDKWAPMPALFRKQSHRMSHAEKTVLKLLGHKRNIANIKSSSLQDAIDISQNSYAFEILHMLERAGKFAKKSSSAVDFIKLLGGNDLLSEEEANALRLAVDGGWFGIYKLRPHIKNILDIVCSQDSVEYALTQYFNANVGLIDDLTMWIDGVIRLEYGTSTFEEILKKLANGSNVCKKSDDSTQVLGTSTSDHDDGDNVVAWSTNAFKSLKKFGNDLKIAYITELQWIASDGNPLIPLYGMAFAKDIAADDSAADDSAGTVLLREFANNILKNGTKISVPKSIANHMKSADYCGYTPAFNDRDTPGHYSSITDSHVIAEYLFGKGIALKKSNPDAFKAKFGSWFSNKQSENTAAKTLGLTDVIGIRRMFEENGTTKTAFAPKAESPFIRLARPLGWKLNAFNRSTPPNIGEFPNLPCNIYSTNITGSCRFSVLLQYLNFLNLIQITQIIN